MLYELSMTFFYSYAAITGQRELVERKDEVKEGTLQLPSSGLPSIPTTDGHNQCLLPQVDNAGFKRCKFTVNLLIPALVHPPR
jgi:hypothetical protein